MIIELIFREERNGSAIKNLSVVKRDERFFDKSLVNGNAIPKERKKGKKKPHAY